MKGMIRPPECGRAAALKLLLSLRLPMIFDT